MSDKIYVSDDGTEFNTKKQLLEYLEIRKLDDKEGLEISNNYVKIMNKLAEAGAELELLQNSCPHKFLRIVAKSDTGNWCRSDDSYWYDITCKCCRLHWTEEQRDFRFNKSADGKNIEWS